MKYAIILLALALSACGYDPEAENSETQSADGEVGEESDSTTRPAKASDDSVNVNVTVEIGRHSGDWLYVESRKTFGEASAGPVGFHLPTRLELLEALTTGDVAEYDGSVWTSEHAADRYDHVYFMRLKDGASFAYPDDSLFGALYRRDSLTKEK